MTPTMIRYRVKADRAEENARYITAVFAQLQREQPPNPRYAAFQLDDGVTFVHLVTSDGTDRGSPLQELTAFQAFVEMIQDRCEEPPVASELKEIGSYRFLGE